MAETTPTHRAVRRAPRRYSGQPATPETAQTPVPQSMPTPAKAPEQEQAPEKTPEPVSGNTPDISADEEKPKPKRHSQR